MAAEKRAAIIETFTKRHVCACVCAMCVDVCSHSSSPQKMVFLMSTKVGGTGLNLTAANVVVLFDPVRCSAVWRQQRTSHTHTHTHALCAGLERKQ